MKAKVLTSVPKLEGEKIPPSKVSLVWGEKLTSSSFQPGKRTGRATAVHPGYRFVATDGTNGKDFRNVSWKMYLLFSAPPSCFTSPHGFPPLLSEESCLWLTLNRRHGTEAQP